MSIHRLADSEMVTALYWALLEREPEPPTLAHYMVALSEGSLDAKSLITLFQNSDKFKYRQRQTNTEEEKLLRRINPFLVNFCQKRIFSGLSFFWTSGYFNFQKIVITNGGKIFNIRVRRCHRRPNLSLCAAAFGDATTAILLKLLLAGGRPGLMI